MSEEFNLPCDWCHREVVSFVGPPAMIEMVVNLPFEQKSFYRICLDCYAELIKLIAVRDWRSVAPDRR